MAGKPKLTKAACEKALREHSGILLKAAEALNVTRQTLYSAIERWPELEDVRREAVEELIDVAEGHVQSVLRAGTDMKTVRWYLERLGKNRGYTTRVETTGADGGPLEFEAVEHRIVDPTEPVPDDANEG